MSDQPAVSKNFKLASARHATSAEAQAADPTAKDRRLSTLFGMAKILATEHDLETLLSEFLSCLIETFVASLNEALVEACKHLGTSGDGLRYLLDVKLNDDNEVANRLGYGALVHSIYVRPTEVWSR